MGISATQTTWMWRWPTNRWSRFRTKFELSCSQWTAIWSHFQTTVFLCRMTTVWPSEPTEARRETLCLGPIWWACQTGPATRASSSAPMTGTTTTTEGTVPWKTKEAGGSTSRPWNNWTRFIVSTLNSLFISCHHVRHAWTTSGVVWRLYVSWYRVCVTSTVPNVNKWDRNPKEDF